MKKYLLRWLACLLACSLLFASCKKDNIQNAAQQEAKSSSIQSSGAVIGVTVMPNGTILGVGTDLQLYTRANLSSAWVAVKV